MQMKGGRLKDITEMNLKKGKGGLSFQPTVHKKKRERERGLQVNIRKVILCCVYCVYVSARQTIFNFPQVQRSQNKI